MEDSAVQADKQNNLKTAAESKAKMHVYCQAKWRHIKAVKESECEAHLCLIKN